jgi:class 3 adenylate cyclase/tetratricopeptide (TPR) repeat protein
MADAARRIGTRSVLFTDLVSSTRLRVELGEEGADALRRTHDALLRDAVIACNGAVVKGLGDGIMATFESAADAVAAAVAIQQAVHTQRFEVRVGVSIGDVSSEGGDVFGVPVVEASRLCDVAVAGEILAAELVRALARGRGGFAFEPMGDLALKGLPEPVTACRVLWDPLVPAAPSGPSEAVGPVPIAPALLGVTATSYVGRARLRARLDEELRTVTAGSECRTVLLAGEPGVGKTRTAAEVARAAHAGGALVLYGRCDEDLGVPYQPFVEALEHYVLHAGSAAALGRTPGELARLVPDLTAHVPGLAVPVATDPASEEHRLFEATASWLIDAARSSDAGLVLVLDDIHWATKPTLLLVQHVVRTAADEQAPILVLATYRDTDITRAHPLAAAIGDLRRLRGVDRLAVDNLSAEEVVDLIVAAAGHELDAPTLRLAAAVHAETEGNPFFVGEVLRHLIETGGVRRDGGRWTVVDADRVSVPEGVRDVVGRRLNRLSVAANEVLSVAAVIGREFDADAVVAIVDSTEDATLDALDEAVRARLIEETGVDRYRFAHALVRTTLYEELSATRRRRLHRRVGDAIEKLRPDDVVALAYHCIEGGPEGDMSRAVRYTLAAAEQALAGRAFAEADARFRQALELLEDDDLPAARAAALCGLGEAQRDQGDSAYRQTLLDAAWQAKAAGDVELFVRAALANSRGLVSIVGTVDLDRLAVVEAALEAVGSAPTPARVRLLAQLASEVTFSGDQDRRVVLSDEAEALARSIGDPDLLGWVLTRTAYPIVTADRTRALVARSREAIALVDASGDPTMRIIARIFGSGAFVSAGEVALADAAIEECQTIADTEGGPIQRWMAVANTVRVLAARGHLDEATARNNENANLGNLTGQPDVASFWASAHLGIELLRGLGTDLTDAIPSFIAEYPGLNAWRCVLPWLLARSGRHDEARAAIVDYELDPVLAVKDSIPFAGLMGLAFAVSELGDVDLAGRTRAVLEPHRGCIANYYTGMTGPIDWGIGLCAFVMGDYDEALQLCEQSAAVMRDAGYAAWENLINVDVARALVATGDDARAREVASEVLRRAEEMNAFGLVTRAQAILDGIAPVS